MLVCVSAQRHQHRAKADQRLRLVPGTCRDAPGRPTANSLSTMCLRRTAYQGRVCPVRGYCTALRRPHGRVALRVVWQVACVGRWPHVSIDEATSAIAAAVAQGKQLEPGGHRFSNHRCAVGSTARRRQAPPQWYVLVQGILTPAVAQDRDHSVRPCSVFAQKIQTHNRRGAKAVATVKRQRIRALAASL